MIFDYQLQDGNARIYHVNPVNRVNHVQHTVGPKLAIAMPEIEPITRHEAEVAFASGVSRDMCMALLGLVYHDDDWQWIQQKCIELCKHSDVAVAGLAITCLGHLARIHRTLELEKVLPVLKELRANAELAGRVDDALSDIEIFMNMEIDRSTINSKSKVN